jgi:hypothetical protein
MKRGHLISNFFLETIVRAITITPKWTLVGTYEFFVFFLFEMEIWILVSIVTISLSIFIATVNRYGSTRQFLLGILGSLQGIPIQVTTDLKLARRVLSLTSDKGFFIERLLATPAWFPILSLESVNGDQWYEMKADFVVLLKGHVPPTHLLVEIARRHVERLLKLEKPIDNRAIARLSLHIFCEWLFEREYEDLEVLVAASYEWRKEISLKGRADSLIKQRAIDWIVSELSRSSRYSDLHDWREPRFYSLILQPFIISPSINLCDIAVSLQQQNGQRSFKRAIHENHPFPMLERFVEVDVFDPASGHLLVAAGTHVFIPLDEMGTLHPFDSTGTRFPSFGAGVRICSGLDMMNALLPVLFAPSLIESDLFVPVENSMHSGRQKDGQETFGEMIYQVKTIASVIWSLMVIRMGVVTRLLLFTKGIAQFGTEKREATEDVMVVK